MDGMNITENRHVTLPISDMLRPTINAGDKLALPVANFCAWANFEYVQGIPAGADGGYSVSKLQILDTIIGNLVGHKNKNLLDSVPLDSRALNESQVDALIGELGQRLQAAVNSDPKGGLAESIGNSFGLAISQTGAALSILV